MALVDLFLGVRQELPQVGYQLPLLRVNPVGGRSRLTVGEQPPLPSAVMAELSSRKTCVATAAGRS
jgi:hypothetical protein